MKLTTTNARHFPADPPISPILCSDAPAEIFFRDLTTLTPGLVQWLTSNFRFLSEADAKDLIQQMHIALWQRPDLLGIPGLMTFLEHSTISELQALTRSKMGLIRNRLKKHLRRRALDFLRGIKTISEGGKYEKVDIDSLRDSLPAASGAISILECSESLTGLHRFLQSGLSEREKIVATIWLRFLPIRPSTAELLEELTLYELKRFLPQNGGSLPAAEQDVAVQAQLSRTRASLEAKIRGFGRSSLN